MGIDLSLVNTGIVILTEAGLVLRRATLRYPLVNNKRKIITEGDKIQRLLCIANDVVGLVKQFSIQQVGIEGPAYGAPLSQHQMGEIAGVVKTQLWLATHIIPMLVPPTTGRKHFLGYGRANKDDVQTILKKVGIDFDTDHEADAYIVARYVHDSLKV